MGSRNKLVLAAWHQHRMGSQDAAAVSLPGQRDFPSIHLRRARVRGAPEPRCGSRRVGHAAARIGANAVGVPIPARGTRLHILSRCRLPGFVGGQEAVAAKHFKAWGVLAVRVRGRRVPAPHGSQHHGLPDCHRARKALPALDARSRDTATPTFAPDGLYFVGPRYDPIWGLPDRTAAYDGLP
jgi:hypothetical protein